MAANAYDQDLQCLKGVPLQGMLVCFNEDSGLPRRYKQAVHCLINRKNIVITRADKEEELVIHNPSAYNTNTFNLLAEKETYIQLTKDPLKNIATEFSKQTRNIIRDEIFSKLKVMSTQLPNFYGLPKIHKEGTSFGPIIISSRNSCINKIS